MAANKRQAGSYLVVSEYPVDRPVGILLLMRPDQEVISAWRDSARFWEKHREIIRQMFAPVTQSLVEDGLIVSGHAVLDIATGPGEPALTIAALVGPEGKVFGIGMRNLVLPLQTVCRSQPTRSMQWYAASV